MWDKIKKLWRDATRLDLTANINKVNGIEAVAKAPDYNKDEHINALQSHIKNLEDEIKSLKRTGDLNTATIENTFAIISAKDAEIADLKKQIKNMRIIGGEMNDYDVPMKGMQL